MAKFDSVKKNFTKLLSCYLISGDVLPRLWQCVYHVCVNCKFFGVLYGAGGK